MTTKIEWADMTINPVVGCSHCSPGCDNCYAERFAARMAKNPKISGKYAGVVDENGKWTGRVNLHMDGCLYAATVTRKPKRFFIGSMTDIFHENIPDEEIRSLFLSMTIVPNDLPTYMVLTKRPHRAKAVLGDMLLTYPELHRVWLGVTVCNQAEADEKIPVLLQTPAAVRFVSVEPMLEAVDLGEYLGGQNVIQQGGRIRISSSSNGRVGDRFFGTNLENCVSQGEPMDGRDDNNPLPETASRKELREIPASSGYGQQETRKCIGSSFGVAAFQRTNTGRHDDKSQKWESEGQQARELRTRHIFGTNSSFIPCPKIASQKRLDGALCWVICGGETGPSARPMHPDWARGLRDQCAAARVPFFFKGWGEWGKTARMSCVDCPVRTRCSSKRAHRFTDGEIVCRVGKRRAGRLLDGVEHNEFPEVNA